MCSRTTWDRSRSRSITRGDLSVAPRVYFPGLARAAVTAAVISLVVALPPRSGVFTLALPMTFSIARRMASWEAR